MTNERYPKQDAMFPSLLEDQYQRFADLREDWLLNFGYNTARAYWADLEDILIWSHERQLNPLALREPELRRYRALLKRRGYSSSTIRRRMTAYRGLISAVDGGDMGTGQ